MARPKKATVDYFPHAADASSRKTLFILEDRFGDKGYIAWFKLLETLCQSPNHFFDARDPENVEFLISKIKIGPEDSEAFFSLCSKLNAIDKDLWENKIIYSQNLVDNIKDAYRKREGKIPNTNLVYSICGVINTISNAGNNQKCAKNEITTGENREIKEKDIKENNNIYPEWLNLELWDLFKKMRKGKNAQLTEPGEISMIEELKKFVDMGYSQEQILNPSIQSSWNGIYKPKDPPANEKPLQKGNKEYKCGHCYEFKKELGCNDKDIKDPACRSFTYDANAPLNKLNLVKKQDINYRVQNG